MVKFGRRSHWGKSAHIKGNTAGTSNELSFSVLDATKQEMDRKHGEARRIQMLGRLDLFTVDGKGSDPVPIIADGDGASVEPSYGYDDQEYGETQRIDDQAPAEEPMTERERRRSSHRWRKRMQEALQKEIVTVPTPSFKRKKKVEAEPAAALEPDVSRETTPADAAPAVLDEAADQSEALASLVDETAAEGDFAQEEAVGETVVAVQVEEDEAIGDDSVAVEEEPTVIEEAPAPKTDQSARDKKRGHRVDTEEARAEAVRKRKENRRLARLGMVAVAAVAVIGLGYFSVVQGMEYFGSWQKQKASVENIMANLAEFDEGIKPLDDALADPFAENLQENVEAAKGFSKSAEELLNLTDSMVSKLEEQADDAAQAKKVQDASASVSNRRKVLELGYGMLDKELEMIAAYPDVADAWDTVLSADAETRAAAAEISSSTGSKLKSARKKTATAADEFKTASEKFEAAGNSYALFDSKPYTKYIDERVKALGHMVASIDYLIAEKTDSAQKSIVKYEESDASAVELARKLPANPESALKEIYQGQVKKEYSQYQRAWKKAHVADEAIANLTGTAGE